MPKGVYERKPRVIPENWSDIFVMDPNSPSGLRWRDKNTAPVMIKSNRSSQPAGSLQASGRYWVVELGSSAFYVHRIVYEMTNGPIPEGHIVDHIDGNSLNNAPSNLRLATQLMNTRNAAARKDNALGVHGVHRCDINKVYVVQWNDPHTGKRRSKCFGYVRCGHEAAIEKARKFRASLNLQGAGYTPRHGA